MAAPCGAIRCAVGSGISVRMMSVNFVVLAPTGYSKVPFRRAEQLVLEITLCVVEIEGVWYGENVSAVMVDAHSGFFELFKSGPSDPSHDAKANN